MFVENFFTKKFHQKKMKNFFTRKFQVIGFTKYIVLQNFTRGCSIRLIR